MKRSWLDELAQLPPSERAEVYRELGPIAGLALSTTWAGALARPEQLAPGSSEYALDPRTDWTFWIYLAGRGTGKTRSGAEWTIAKAKAHPDAHIALVAPTTDDCRSVMLSAGREHMPEASGILAVSPADFRPRYEPSKRSLTWPNGCVATLYSAEEPDRLRGPQHHFAWIDEVAAWSRLQDAWDMLLFGLRLGEHPQACITTTPRPIPLLLDLLRDSGTVVTRGTTYDNRPNLSPHFYASIISRYEGTRLGRQELLGEILTDNPGAMWSLAQLEALRVVEAPSRLYRIVIGVDPAVTANAESCETGIVAAGVGPCLCQGPLPGGKPPTHGFVLRDVSGKYAPAAWAAEVHALYRRLHADRVIGEVNNGGDLVESNLRAAAPGLSYKAVRASRGKSIRAEPVAALYEQGRVHHVGTLVGLEDQMTLWDPTDDDAKSPDRVDALVWALTELMVDAQIGPMEYTRVRSSRWGDDRRLP